MRVVSFFFESSSFSKASSKFVVTYRGLMIEKKFFVEGNHHLRENCYLKESVILIVLVVPRGKKDMMRITRNINVASSIATSWSPLHKVQLM